MRWRYMCTLWLYALYNIATPSLLPSIINCNSQLLIHAYFEALWSHTFCIFVVLTLYVSPYIWPLRDAGTSWAHADASCSPWAQPESNSVTSHTGWTGWLLPLRNTKGRMFLHAWCPAEVGEISRAEACYVFCCSNMRAGAALAHDSGASRVVGWMNFSLIHDKNTMFVVGEYL